MRRAKILATLGPASNNKETIARLIQAGMNAIRINRSHGTQAEHTETIRIAREVAKELGEPLAVLVDLSGPKIRTGKLEAASAQLINGERFVITSRDVPGDVSQVSTNYKDLPKAVRPGETILLDDGALTLQVEEVTETDVICRVIDGGFLFDHKGINLPHTHLPIPSLTQKDREDLEWAMAQNVDYIALSFVRTAKDCTEAKELIKGLNERLQLRKHGRALLVAKIEKAEAIENLDEIIQATDGVMVARGDLGVETSVEMVPVYQKMIIQKAVANDCFVITATQMLQSMIEHSHPTRAEASDIANAVWDGTDAVMLSAETASGKYPVESLATMAKIIESAETIKPKFLKKPVKFTQEPTGRTSQALCVAAAYAAKEKGTEKVAVFTESGLMARRLSSFRSGLNTFAITTSEDARQQLALIWGVRPLFHMSADSTEAMLKTGEKVLLENGAVKEHETIIMMAGRLSGLGLSSSVVMWTISEGVPRK
jgi:pyruvate kinase